MGHPYRDKEWFAERWNRGDPRNEMATEAGCSPDTITEWAKRHGLQLRRNDGPLNDPGRLEHDYYERGLSINKMADEYGVYPSSVSEAMERHGLREKGEWYADPTRPPQFTLNVDGYEYVSTETGGKTYSAPIHRLVAIANGTDPHEFFGGNKRVHHKNDIPWDNRPSNLAVMDVSDHGRHHAPEPEDGVPVDTEEFRRRWEQPHQTRADIGEHFGYDAETIGRWASELRFPPKRDTRPWRDPEVLRHYNHELEMNRRQTALELGCDPGTVTYNMKKNDIKIRN